MSERSTACCSRSVRTCVSSASIWIAATSARVRFALQYVPDRRQAQPELPQGPGQLADGPGPRRRRAGTRPGSAAPGGTSADVGPVTDQLHRQPGPRAASPMLQNVLSSTCIRSTFESPMVGESISEYAGTAGGRERVGVAGPWEIAGAAADHLWIRGPNSSPHGCCWGAFRRQPGRVAQPAQPAAMTGPRFAGGDHTVCDRRTVIRSEVTPVPSVGRLTTHLVRWLSRG